MVRDVDREFAPYLEVRGGFSSRSPMPMGLPAHGTHRSWPWVSMTQNDPSKAPATLEAQEMAKKMASAWVASRGGAGPLGFARTPGRSGGAATRRHLTTSAGRSATPKRCRKGY